MLKRVNSIIVAALAIFATAAFLTIAGTSDALAAKPCKYEGSALADAIEACGGKLKCSEKTPPQEISCTGRTNRWMCKCVKPKGSPNSKYGIFARIGLETKVELMSRPIDN